LFDSNFVARPVGHVATGRRNVRGEKSMNDNELSGAITTTQAAAAEAVAAFNASASPDLLEGQPTGTVSTARATAAAAAKSYATRRGVSEQRHVNFRLWVQSFDGQTYCDWAARASLLSQAITARNEAVEAIWRCAAGQGDSPAQPDDVTAGEVTAAAVRSRRARSIRRCGITLILLSPVAWVWAHLFWPGAGAEMSVQAILPSVLLLLGSAGVVAGVGMARPLRRENSNATVVSAGRMTPGWLTAPSQPGQVPSPWTEDAKVGQRLDQFMHDAYTNFPKPGELPALRIPDVRAGRTEPSLPVRALLEQFAAADALEHL
jgi:uncharacterized protein YfiM (DUF2279 family)